MKNSSETNNNRIDHIPVSLLIKHHNPLTEDSGWECWGMTKEMFTNVSDEFIKEQLGHLDYGTVYESRFYGIPLEGETPWEDEELDNEESDDEEDEFEEEQEFDPSDLYDYHIARVAYLMKNPDTNPIDVDVEYLNTENTEYNLWVMDGNHRLLAHYLTGAETIPASLSGFHKDGVDVVEWLVEHHKM